MTEPSSARDRNGEQSSAPPWDWERDAAQNLSGLQARLAAGPLWQDTGLVFTTGVGTPLDASHVRRDFRALCKKAGIEGVWAPRELRHTFVSVMSVSGVAVEEIARLARAYAMTRKDAAAVNLLLAAERLSPQLIRYDPATRDVLTELLRRESVAL